MQNRVCLNALGDYVPGQSLAGKVKMSSNENPLGPSPRALAALEQAMPNLHRYPQGHPEKLAQGLAKLHGLPVESVLCGNGSDEIIYLAAATYLNPGDQVLLADHTFSEYRFSSTILDAQVRTVAMDQGHFRLDRFLSALDSRTRIIFLCSPNNPTGTLISRGEIEDFLPRIPQNTLVLLDQAYGEFVDDQTQVDLAFLCLKHPNLLITHTFSKVYGLAGLRIGYGLAHPATMAQIRRIKPPFNTSVPAQVMALASLEDRDHLERSLELNRQGRHYLHQRLGSMAGLGLAWWPSHANFVALDLRRDSARIHRELIEAGYIIRPLASFGLPGCIRISIDTPEHNQGCLDALEEICRRWPLDPTFQPACPGWPRT